MKNHSTHPVTALFVASMVARAAAVVERDRAADAVRTAVKEGRLHEDALYVDVPLPVTLADAKAVLAAESEMAAGLSGYLYGSGPGPDLYSQWSELNRLARAELLFARAEVVVAALSDREFVAVAG